MFQRRDPNYIAGLQDPFNDKYMSGKSNFKLKSL